MGIDGIRSHKRREHKAGEANARLSRHYIDLGRQFASRAASGRASSASPLCVRRPMGVVPLVPVSPQT